MKTWIVAGVLLLAGCANQATTIRIFSKDATIAALVVGDATKEDAKKLETLAISVSDSIEGGVVDLQALRQQILAAIGSQFSGNKEILLLALVDDIITLVMGEIDPTTPPSEIFVLIDAAADGVAEGAAFYGAVSKRSIILKVK